MTSTLVSDDAMTTVLASDENEKQCAFESCKDFGKRFSDKAFKNHKYQYHNESYKLNYIDQQGKKKRQHVENELILTSSDLLC